MTQPVRERIAAALIRELRLEDHRQTIALRRQAEEAQAQNTDAASVTPMHNVLLGNTPPGLFSVVPQEDCIADDLDAECPCMPNIGHYLMCDKGCAEYHTDACMERSFPRTDDIEALLRLSM